MCNTVMFVDKVTQKLLQAGTSESGIRFMSKLVSQQGIKNIRNKVYIWHESVVFKQKVHVKIFGFGTGSLAC